MFQPTVGATKSQMAGNGAGFVNELVGQILYIKLFFRGKHFQEASETNHPHYEVQLFAQVTNPTPVTEVE